MNRILLFLLFTFYMADGLKAQSVTDLIYRKPADTLNSALDPTDPITSQELTWKILQQHPYFGFSAEPSVYEGAEPRKVNGKEGLFYSLIALLIVFALLKQFFAKYFSDLFRLFFRTTLKQRQISEQLMQTPLPSILLNGFFVISAGFYISFVVDHYKMNPFDSFWALLLYCITGLAVIYFLKYLGLRISGWVFNVKEAADSYIFIVFVINKMTGILLLPFLVLLAFTVNGVYTVGFTLSLFLIGGMLAYRFILTYAAVRNQVSLNPFHFFLYFCAFEIAPLLLLYKALLVVFGINA